MVEVVCAVAVLAIITIAVVTGVSLSRTTIVADNNRDQAYARAQGPLDVLLEALDGKTGQALNAAQIQELESLTGAEYSASWPPASMADGKTYFTVTAVAGNPGAGDGVSVYNIRAEYCYAGGGKSAELKATASGTGEGVSAP